jgi:hypothetical protein
LRIFLIQSIHEAAVSLCVTHTALFLPVEECRLQTAQGIKQESNPHCRNSGRSAFDGARHLLADLAWTGGGASGGISRRHQPARVAWSAVGHSCADQRTCIVAGACQLQPCRRAAMNTEFVHVGCGCLPRPDMREAREVGRSCLLRHPYHEPRWPS